MAEPPPSSPERVRIAFSDTVRAVRERQQTVSRRLSPPPLAVGDLVDAVASDWMVRHKGPLTPLAVIRIVSLREEPLSRILNEPEYGREELAKEGGPAVTLPTWALTLLVRYKRLSLDTPLTRIEFEYL